MKKSLVALALAAAPFFVNASESNGIGYNYAQLDYTYQDADGPYLKGGVLSGSYAFNDNVFATASYGKSSDTYNEWFHGARVKAKSEAWSLGVGFNTAIGSRADWVTQVAYADNDMSVRARDNTCTALSFCGERLHLHGGKVSTGVLGRVTDQLTANAYLGYEDYNHGYEGAAFAEFGAVYSFNPTWGVHTGLTLAENSQTYSLGVRASF